MGDPAAHSVFAASSSARLLACPGSFRLTKAAQQQGVRNRGSYFASEGTVAHSLAEAALLGKGTPASFLGTEYTQDGHDITVDQDMVDGVQLFLDTCNQALAGSIGFHAELRVRLDKLWPNGKPPLALFGTADFVTWHKRRGLKPGRMTIADLKYGRGTVVENKDNPQLLYYALGALLHLDLVDVVGMDGVIETIIIQPRASHADGPVRRAEYSVLDVLAWGQEVLKPGVDLALKNDAPVRSGSHCKFCPAKLVCPALHTAALTAAKDEFGEDAAEPLTLTSRDLAGVLDRMEQVQLYVDACRAEAEARITAGEQINGWKVVQRRGNRTWNATPAQLASFIESHGYGAAEPILGLNTRPTIGSVAAVKKRMDGMVQRGTDKPLFDAVAEQFVTQSSPGNALVRSSDPRPGLRGHASADFD